MDANRIEVSVEIARTPDVIWPVLIDVQRWPEWTPSVTAVERVDRAPFGIGSRARVRQPGLKTMVWEVSEFQPEKLFTWQTRSVGISVVASHEIRKTERGSTVTLHVDQRGWLSALLRPFIGSITENYMNMEARGLKKRCEALMTLTSLHL